MDEVAEVLSSDQPEKVSMQELQEKLQGFENEVKSLQELINQQNQQILVEQEGRVEDKKWMAALWPDDCPPPTLLRPYYSIDEEDREQQLLALEKANRKKTEAEKVIFAMKKASAWVECFQYDEDAESSAVYYQNEETGESVWDKPKEMLYSPPEGWDVHHNTWKENWGPDGNELEVDLEGTQDAEDVEVDSKVKDALRIARADYSETEMEGFGIMNEDVNNPNEKSLGSNDSNDGDNSDKNNEDGESDDEEAIEDPIMLREEFDKVTASISSLESSLEKSKRLQESISYRIQTCEKQLYAKNKLDLEEAMELKLEKEEELKKERKKKLIAAKAEAEAILKKSRDRGDILSKEEQKDILTEVINKTMEASKNNSDDVEIASDPKLCYPLSSVNEIRFFNPSIEEETHNSCMQKLLGEMEELEIELQDKHDMARETSNERYQEVSELLDKVTEEHRIMKNQSTKLHDQRNLLQDPILEPLKPVFEQPIDEFEPSEETEEEQQEDTQSEVNHGSFSEDGSEEKDDNDGENIDFLTWRKKKGLLNEEEKNEESDKNGMEMNELTAESTEQIIDENLSDEEKRSLWLQNCRKIEQERRDKILTEYECKHNKWKVEEIERKEALKELDDQILLVDNHCVKLEEDLGYINDDKEFLESILEADNRKGSVLFEKQSERQVQVVKIELEKIIIEETLMKITKKLEEMKNKRSDAERIPLQAMNPIDALHLEGKMTARLKEIDNQIEEILSLIDEENAKKEKIILIERNHMHFHHTRLKEESRVSNEKSQIWDLYMHYSESVSVFQCKLDYLYKKRDSNELDKDINVRDIDSVDGMCNSDSSNMAPPPSSINDDEVHAASQNLKNTDISPMESKIFKTKDDFTLEAKIQIIYTGWFNQVGMVRILREMLVLYYNRENRWRECAVPLFNFMMRENQDKSDPNNSWLTSQERKRYEERILLLEEKLKQQQNSFHRTIQGKEKTIAEQSNDLAEIKEKVTSYNGLSTEKEGTLLGKNLSSIEELKLQISTLKSELKEKKHLFDIRLKSLMDEHENIRLKLESEMQINKKKTNELEQWLTSVRNELRDAKAANCELMASYKALEKRKATEVNDYYSRLFEERKKTERLEMWNASLKLRIKEIQKKENQARDDLEKQDATNRLEQRKLRHQIWCQRISAQTMLTDVDLLFEFFMEALHFLAGSDDISNNKIRLNLGIEILGILCRSQKTTIQQLAAASLGKLGWNQNIVPRWIGWTAKKMWLKWVDKLASKQQVILSEQNKKFDDFNVEQHDDNEQNLLAEGNECTLTAQQVLLKVQSKSRPLRCKDAETPNVANQEYLGQAPGVIQGLVSLCHNNGDLVLLESAISSLAVTSLNSRNAASMGRMDSCLKMLIKFCDLKCDPRLVLNAAGTLANISYNCTYNQNKIQELGGLNCLIQLLHSTDVDVLHSASAALANMCSGNDQNSTLIAVKGGIPLLLELFNSHKIADLVELKGIDEIQLNAAECLVNILHSNDAVVADTVGKSGVKPFIYLCVSEKKILQRYAALMLGNLAQNDSLRLKIGEGGGISALFNLINDENEIETQVKASWALSNLGWNRENQERIGGYLPQLYEICTCSFSLEMREYGMCILGNILFFNKRNGNRIGKEKDKWFTLLLEKLTMYLDQQSLTAMGESSEENPSDLSTVTDLMLQHVSRAICALLCLDVNALLFADMDGIPIIINLFRSKKIDTTVQENLMNAIINLCVHDVNKRRMLDYKGVEVLVDVSGSLHRKVADKALEALELLADVPRLHELKDRKADINIEGMIGIMTRSSARTNKAASHVEDNLLIGMAAETIAEEAFLHPSNKKSKNKVAINDKGIEALISILRPQKNLNRQAILPVLWAIRNLTFENRANQDRVWELKGVQYIIAICDQHRSDEELLEAGLAALVNIVLDHERNSRLVLSCGIDLLIDTADTVDDDNNDADELNAGQDIARSNSFLARSILEIIGPHNWILCLHCGSKEMGGTRCGQCGRSISFIAT